MRDLCSLVNSLTMQDVIINLQNAAKVILDSNPKPEYGFGLNNLDSIWKTDFGSYKGFTFHTMSYTDSGSVVGAKKGL